MKRIFIIIVLPVFVFCQIDFSNGIPIRQGNHIEWSRGAISSEDGGMIVVWSDTRNGDRDLFLQKISASGDVQWGESGTPVIRASNRQEDPVLVTDANSGLILAWVDYEQDSTGDIRSARIDQDGNLVWIRDVCIFSGKQTSIRMADDGLGGAYISWIDYRATTDGDIFISHVDSSGNIAPDWGENGKAVCSATGVQETHTIDKDGTGGAFVAWTDHRNTEETTIYMQRYTPDGTAHFQTDGIQASLNSGEKKNPKIAFSGEYGVCLVWIDRRNDFSGDLYAQKYDTLGNPLWDNSDVPVCVESYSQLNPRISSDRAGGCIISWEDYRQGGIQSDIYCQRISAEGSPVFSESGLLVCGAAGNQVESRLSTDTSGIFIIWVDERNGGYPHQDIYGQYLDFNGTLMWSEDGEIVCQARYYQFAPLFRPVTEGVSAVWGDMRNGSPDLVVQKFSLNGEPQLELDGKILIEGIDGDAKNPIVLSDFQETGNRDFYVFWEDDRNGISGTKIYVQKIGDCQSPEWEENGIPVSAISEAEQKNLSAAYNGVDFYCAWVEDNLGMQSVHAQKISSAGELLWGEHAFSVSDAIDVGDLKTGTFSDGDLLIGWSDYSSEYYYQINLVRLNQDSTLVWNGGTVSFSNPGSDVYFEDLGIVKDTIVVVWRSGSWNDQNIFASIISPDGELIAPKITICDTVGFQLNAKLSHNNSEIWVAWEDFRTGSADIYIQVLLPSGLMLLPFQGYPVVTAINDQSSFSMDAGPVSGERQVTLSWQDFRNGSDYDAYYQVLKINGQLKTNSTDIVALYPDDGLQLDDNAFNQNNPACLRYGPVVWEDLRNGITSDLYYSYPRSEADVMPLCLAENKQINPILMEFSGETTLSDTAVVVWEDKRSSGKTELLNLYFKVIERGSLPQSVEQEQFREPESFHLLTAYPNPFNSRITFEFESSPGMPVEFSVFDISGKRIMQRDLVSDANGRVKFAWNGVSESGNILPSGEYLVRAKDKSKTATTRIIMLK